MLEAFTYAVLWRSKDALPGLLELLPEAARTEVGRVAREAAGLSGEELAARIAELRNRDLGPVENCPANLLEWKYRRRVEQSHAD
jgi:hypothetical protein